MSSSPSYRTRRSNQNCIRYGSSPEEPCWGEVFGSSRGLECKGHAGGGEYSRELTDGELELARQEAERQQLAAAVAKAEENERQRQRWEATRWFRPLLDRAPTESSMWWMALPEPVLKMVFSMLGEGITVSGASSPVIEALKDSGLPAIAEVRRRGLEWPVDAYNLKLSPHPPKTSRYRGIDPPFADRDLMFDVTQLSDRELLLWSGCATQVMDYSLLEQGTRQVVAHLWHLTEAEGERRGIDLMYLLDLETLL